MTGMYDIPNKWDIETDLVAMGASSSGMLDGIAVLVTLGAIWIEATADKQLHKFLSKEKEPGEILNKGLWAYS